MALVPPVVVLLLLDFLLPFYYLLISSSGLFTVLTASMSPIPKQKPTIPIPIKDPIAPLVGPIGPSDLLEVYKFLFIFIVSTCSPFLLCSDK